MVESDENPAKRMRLNADAELAAQDNVEEDDILARVRALAEATAASVATMSGLSQPPKAMPVQAPPTVPAEEPAAGPPESELRSTFSGKGAGGLPPAGVMAAMGGSTASRPMSKPPSTAREQPPLMMAPPSSSGPLAAATAKAPTMSGPKTSAAGVGQQPLQAPVMAPPRSRTAAGDSRSATAAAVQAAGAQLELAEGLGAPDALLYSLVQLAEESGQIASAVAAFCATTGCSDMQQVTTVCETSVQASKRANWASGAADSYAVPVVEEEDEKEQMEQWVSTMRKFAAEAAKVADKAAEECRTYLRQLSASAVAAQEVAQANAASLAAFGQEDALQGGPPMRQREDRGSRVPCRYFMAGRCVKGSACDFSHDAQDMQARPVFMKLDRPCAFFDRGQCLRGAACPFAHGQEELEEITKARAERAAEKGMGKGFGKYRMSWTPRGTLVPG